MSLFRVFYGFGIAWLAAGIVQSSMLLIVVGSVAIGAGAALGWDR